MILKPSSLSYRHYRKNDRSTYQSSTIETPQRDGGAYDELSDVGVLADRQDEMNEAVVSSSSNNNNAYNHAYEDFISVPMQETRRIQSGVHLYLDVIGERSSVKG